MSKKRSLETLSTRARKIAKISSTNCVSPLRQIKNNAGAERPGKTQKKEKKTIRKHRKTKQIPFQLLAKDDPAVQSQAAHIQKLADASFKIESRFYINGELSLRGAPLKIELTSSGKQLQFPMSIATFNSVALQELLTASSAPSPSRAGTKVVADSTAQVLPSNFTANLDVVSSGLLERVRKALVPDVAKITAELHKLDYHASGDFSENQDTPSDTTTFGFLVVALPTPFEGGQLSMSHGEDGHIYSINLQTAMPSRNKYEGDDAWQKRKEAYTPQKFLRWAAFFNDVKHSVKKVTGGNRLTLTYKLRRSVASTDTDQLRTRSVGLQNALRDALRDPTFMPTGGGIGFYCRHLYEEPALSKTERKLQKAQGTKAKGVTAQALKLKNEDAVVAVAAASFGLRVRVLRVMIQRPQYHDDEFLLSKMPNKTDLKKLGCLRTCKVFNGGFTFDVQKWTAVDADVRAFAAGIVERDEAQVVWLQSKEHWCNPPPRKTLCVRQYSPTGSFRRRDDACRMIFYASTRLVVDIPAAADRVTQLRSPTPLLGEELRTKKQQELYEKGVEPGKRAPLFPEIIPAHTGNRTVLIEMSSAKFQAGYKDYILEKDERVKDGFFQVKMVTGAGLKFLKKIIRINFGKVPYHKLGTLTLIDSGRPAKSKDLVDGVKLRCTYTRAKGNAAAMHRARDRDKRQRRAEQRRFAQRIHRYGVYF